MKKLPLCLSVRKYIRALTLSFIGISLPYTGYATTFTVSDLSDILGPNTLRTAINSANAETGVDSVINFTSSGTVTLDSGLGPLPILRKGANTLSINGNAGGTTIDGNNDTRIFFAETGTITIKDMSLTNALGKGGDGGDGRGGGGGGMGAGAALLVDTAADVTVENVIFSTNTATGGIGGDRSAANRGGGGGGGFGGDGGTSDKQGGGGGGGFAGDGATTSGNRGGGGGGGELMDGNANAGNVGGDGGNGSTGTGGTGGSGANVDGGDGTAIGGGGGGGSGQGSTGGMGGDGDKFGGGGGGGHMRNGGDGGDFAGGGGAGRNSATAIGGDGGFGGGSGSGRDSGGTPGFGAGTGGAQNVGGDGGDAHGGAVFVREGGKFKIINNLTSKSEISGNTLTAGAGGTGTANGSAGTASGEALFIMSGVEAEIDVDTGLTMTISDTIAGDGGIKKSNAGTLVLTETNLYKGDTKVTGGILEVSADSNMGDAFSDLTLDGGTLQVTAPITIVRDVNIGNSGATIDTDANTVTMSGQFFGTSSLTKIDTGKLILTNTANNYIGPTTISAGTLQGNSGSIKGNINNAGALIFDQNFSGSFMGQISGAGTFEKIGSDNLTLSATSDYTGPTTVTAGKLTVNGSIGSSSAVSVALGATLSGGGTVGPLTNGGTVAPGDMGIGNLKVNGAFTQSAAASVMEMEITPSGTNDKITATSAVDVTGGTLTIIPTGVGMFSNGQTFQIIKGSTLTAFAFDSVTPPTIACFTVTLVNGTDSLSILLGSIAFSSTITGGNPGIMAEYLDSLTLTDTDLNNLILALLNHNPGTLRDTFNQIHPAQLTDINTLVQENTSLILNNVCSHCQSHIFRIPSNKKYLIWARPFYQFNDSRRMGDNRGFDAHSKGITLGLDHPITENLLLGISGSYSNTSLKWNPTGGGDANIDNYFGGLYSSLSIGNLLLDASVFGYYFDASAEREINFSSILNEGFTRTAKSKHKGHGFAPQLCGSYLFNADPFSIQPFGSIHYNYTKHDKFTETNAGSTSFKIDSRTEAKLHTELGSRIYFKYQNGNQEFIPFLKASWVQSILLSDAKIRATLITQEEGRTFQGSHKDMNLLGFGTGLIMNRDDLQLSIDYSGKIGNNYRVHAIKLCGNMVF